jgi:1,4-dihydroxy-2-naphthoate polyprenyltransferase
MESTLRNWVRATRPKTLPAVLAPIILAVIIANKSRPLDPGLVFAVLVFGICIQILTNFVNDLFDFLKGADNKNRTGPKRVIESGLISISNMKLAIGVITLFSLVIAFYLTSVVGYPILLLSLVSIALAYAYTTGPFPLSYLGLGDIFVFLFFGPIACGASYFIFTQKIDFLPLSIGCALGLISSAILVVNNIRDFVADKKAKKNTLVVRFGRKFGRMEYLILLIGACLIPLIIGIRFSELRGIVLCSGFVLLALPTIKNVLTTESSVELNSALENTGKMLIIFCFLFFIGFNL